MSAKRQVKPPAGTQGSRTAADHRCRIRGTSDALGAMALAAVGQDAGNPRVAAGQVTFSQLAAAGTAGRCLPGRQDGLGVLVLAPARRRARLALLRRHI